MKNNEILDILKLRFEKNMNRHVGIIWNEVYNKLVNNKDKIDVLIKMEETGGEPDVVSYDKPKGEYIFYDCSKESPAGRRSLCYDRIALESREKFPPENSAIDVAKEIGIEILNEKEYRYLQSLGEFDQKTSTWVKTPDEIRKLGGAIFCDRRYNNVFTYHNGADSYYSVRGFRGSLRV